MNVMNEKMKQIAAWSEGLKFYFVGGSVRDILLGKEPKDYDLVTPALPEEIEAFFRAKHFRVYTVGKRFGTIGVKMPITIDGQTEYVIVEFTTYRKEQYDGVSRKPVVEFSDNVHEDLSRRDFTINALLIDHNGEVRDPLGVGIDDLNNKVLRAVGNPKARFKDDPLRILRGVRMAAKYGLTVDAKTEEKMESVRFELLRLSKERIVDELTKIMALPADALGQALTALWTLKIWQVIFPAMQLQFKFDQVNPHHHMYLHMHSTAVAQSVRRSIDDGSLVVDVRPEIAVLTGLMHDVAKPFTATMHKSGTRYNYINHDIIGATMVEGWTEQYKMSKAEQSFMVETIKTHLEDTNWLRPHDNAGKKQPASV